jgi:DNA-binding MarR family transcriptional regulator
VARRIAEAFAVRFPDLRLAHLGVFQHVDHPPGGSRLTVLADRSGITKQALIEIVDYLEEHGYVERIPDPADRRAKLIRMTALGWSVHEAAFSVVEELQREWAETLGPAKMRRLLGLLGELNDRLGLNVRHG